MAISTLKYETLPAGHIRLLEWKSNDTLAFSLKSVALAEAPPYVALSYVWGYQDADRPISVNDQSFNVRPNLHAFLLHLQRYGSRHLKQTQSTNLQTAWRYIWTDAICINQECIPERSQQVSIMGTIFHTASTVLAWLGEEPASIYQGDVEGWTANNNKQDLWFGERRPNFLQSDYFSRMWIVQEVLLARELHFFLGSTELDMEDLAWYADTTFFLDHTPEEMHLRSVSALWQWAKKGGADALKQPLHLLLMLFGTCHCWDPRDKVFSLLGILPDAERKVLSKYFPDYTRTKEEVVLITLSILRPTMEALQDEVRRAVFYALGVYTADARRKFMAAATGYDPERGPSDVRNRQLIQECGRDLLDEAAFLVRSQPDPPLFHLPAPAHTKDDDDVDDDEEAACD